VHDACGWAIERLTRERLLPAETVLKMRRDWFLSPDK